MMSSILKYMTFFARQSLEVVYQTEISEKEAGNLPFDLVDVWCPYFVAAENYVFQTTIIFRGPGQSVVIPTLREKASYEVNRRPCISL